MRVSKEMVEAYDGQVENKEAFFREVMVNGEVLASEYMPFGTQANTVKFKGILYVCTNSLKRCQKI